VVVVAGVHDYLYQQGRLALTEQWWLPFATPLMVLAFSVLMVRRVVSAMSQVEVLNQTLEQRVKDRTEALAVAHAAKSRFLAAASHDLRQPVVTIGLLVGLLREQITTPALRSMVVKVDEAVAAMESLLAGLLDLSRLESGTVRARWQRVPLQALFDAVAVHESETARRKGLALRVRPTDLAVQADPVLLEQIVRNLVSNAVRYTDVGGVLLAARRSGPGQLSIQVWDTGPGIAPDKQAAVFEEFVQLDNPQRDRSKGLGLGLAIVQRSAALLHAPLQLRSRLGRGSCFSFTLGLADGATAQVPARAPDERWLAGMQIVLVEDDMAVREALVTRLQAWGAQVRAHAEPRALRQALDALQPGERQADLLITDLRLPGGTGFDVVDLARRRFGPLPVLVITGNTAPTELAQLEARQVPVLHKPFRADELRSALSLALAGRPSVVAPGPSPG
jgi:signal transduction histidine kinase/ActR/RegA family two-component response regulator